MSKLKEFMHSDGRNQHLAGEAAHEAYLLLKADPEMQPYINQYIDDCVRNPNMPLPEIVGLAIGAGIAIGLKMAVRAREEG